LIRRLSLVAFFLEVGVLLIVLPWSQFWEENYFALASPLLHAVVENDFVRGGITGLGVVNLIVGFVDLAIVISTRERSTVSIRDRTERPLR
jgi:hypothetical protein